eukprot:CAMPEP_0201592708 /NCGR_PEP_ID=MMETSP0190_2-20130828/190532_1 /ASSEMBLY_ACC=CAM_ASM_000263 /TAXON_ID=37353 /ORGANISM="Rosalina sp." /LENGTH=298 /DNA_ID=CAMNT_0048051607 /DNA_START=43 /DNA_END=939 /DNA_ORIENTATION=+
MSSINAGSSLGDFLSREHGLKRKVNMISTTTTTYISEIDNTVSIDEWCLIAPGQQQSMHKMNQLTQRVNELEYTTKQLMTRLSHLEKNSSLSLPSSNVAAIANTERKAIMAPPAIPKALTLPITNKQKQIEYKCCIPKRVNTLKLCENGQSLQNALILQKQKILARKGKRKRVQKMKKKVVSTQRRNPFQQELYQRVRDPQLKESWHILKARAKVDKDPHREAVNIEPKPRNPFQRELYERVRDPQLKESWHILKARAKVDKDPHREAVMKFCQDLMSTKSTLKRVPSPDCKTIIVLD